MGRLHAPIFVLFAKTNNYKLFCRINPKSANPTNQTPNDVCEKASVKIRRQLRNSKPGDFRAGAGPSRFGPGRKSQDLLIITKCVYVSHSKALEWLIFFRTSDFGLFYNMPLSFNSRISSYVFALLVFFRIFLRCVLTVLMLTKSSLAI